MKKLLSIVLALSATLMLNGCLNETPEVEEVEVLVEIPEVEEVAEIEYKWLQLENGGCIARDLESGMLYMENEVGELAPYMPDWALVDDPSALNIPESFTPIGETETVTPVWLQMESGAPIARDPETGMLYAGNEVGEYAPYMPDLAGCEK